jgi:DNA polymerase-3 subunit beta
MHISDIDAAAPAFAALSVDARELVEALAWLRKAAWEARCSVPMLSCVRIEARPDATVTLDCTDLDRFGTVTLAATVSSPGAFLVDRATLADFAKRAAKGKGALTIVDDGDGRTRFSGGGATATLNTLPATGWPTLNRKPSDTPLSVNYAAADLAADLARLAPAMSKEETRYYLRGVCFDVLEGELRLAATNGHALSLIERGARVDCGDMMPIVPDRAIHGIAAMLKGEESASIAIHALHGEAVAGAKRLAFKLIDGSFPDWRRVIPVIEPGAPALRVAGSELVAHCATAAKGQKHRELRIEAGADIMAGQVNPAPHARPLLAEYDGAPIAIAFDAPIIEPIAKTCGMMTLAAFSMATGTDKTLTGEPFLIRDDSAPHWTGVVMPLRVQGELPRPRPVQYVDVKPAPGKAADLFGVEPFTGNRACGKGSDKPRKATNRECLAYLVDYAKRCGLPGIDGLALIIDVEGPRGLVVGEMVAPVYAPEPKPGVYAEGAYCVPMPGRNQAPVTVQTQGDDGEWSEPMTCVDDKGRIALPDAPKVRKARKAKIAAVERIEAPSATDAAPEHENAPQPPVSGEIDPIAELTARLDAAEAAIAERPRIRVKAIAVPIDEPPSVENVTVGPWAGARERLADRDSAAIERAARERARRERIVRAYLKMRRERDAAREDARENERERLRVADLARVARDKRRRAVKLAHRHWKMRLVARGQYQAAERDADRQRAARHAAALTGRALAMKARSERDKLAAYRDRAAVQYDRVAAERDAAKRILADARDKLATVERERDAQAHAIAALASRVERVEAAAVERRAA